MVVHHDDFSRCSSIDLDEVYGALRMRDINFYQHFDIITAIVIHMMFVLRLGLYLSLDESDPSFHLRFSLHS